jgi:hypothetical protein
VSLVGALDLSCLRSTPLLTELFQKVPPKDNLEKVPLGASSASMYPGYSPADHIYGEAAQEYGEHAAVLKRKGVELTHDPHGPQYVVGQSKKLRRLSQEPETLSGFVSSASAHHVNGEDQGGEPMEGVEQSTDVSQYFVIDSRPTPISELGDLQKHRNKANDKAKRRVSFKDEQDDEAASNDVFDAPKMKKVKISAPESHTAVSVESEVREEDISAEVEARLKAKEEKRKSKEEKKRKRDSAESMDNAQTPASIAQTDGHVEPPASKKPKKKTHKKSQDDVVDAAAHPSNTTSERSSKKDKEKKKKRASADEQATTEVEHEKAPKNSTKDKPASK